jgi:hypothetical protein
MCLSAPAQYRLLTRAALCVNIKAMKLPMLLAVAVLNSFAADNTLTPAANTGVKYRVQTRYLRG